MEAAWYSVGEWDRRKRGMEDGDVPRLEDNGP